MQDSNTGKVKIVDFGSAMLISPALVGLGTSDDHPQPSSSPLTCNPAFHSPESSSPSTIYATIKGKPLKLPPTPAISKALAGFLHCLLDKDPATRIDIVVACTHPWVTSAGAGPLREAPLCRATLTSADHSASLTSSTCTHPWVTYAGAAPLREVPLCRATLTSSGELSASLPSFMCTTANCSSLGSVPSSLQILGDPSHTLQYMQDSPVQMQPTQMQYSPVQMPAQPSTQLLEEPSNTLHFATFSAGPYLVSMGVGLALAGAPLAAALSGVQAVVSATKDGVASLGLHCHVATLDPTDSTPGGSVTSELMGLAFEEVLVPPHTNFISYGDPVDKMYLIAKGEVEIYHNTRDQPGAGDNDEF
eukprot:gene30161-35141_t